MMMNRRMFSAAMAAGAAASLISARGMAANPGGEQLVGAQAQHLAHGSVQLADGPVAALCEDRVVGAAAAQRAVGKLGGERGVPAGDLALVEDRRQQQVGVGAAVGDSVQDIVGGQARGVRPAPAAA